MRVAGKFIIGVFTTAIIACAIPYQTRPNPKLWDASPKVIDAAVQEFIQSPGTKPDETFVFLKTDEEQGLRFKAVPEGWDIDAQNWPVIREIAQDRQGFRIRISLKSATDKEMADHVRPGDDGKYDPRDLVTVTGGIQVPRTVECYKGKGVTTYVFERRYFKTPSGAICVEFFVTDSPGQNQTLEDLLTFLHANYGKYEGVCRQVAGFVRGEKK
ncbi:hypothetical protein [Zavarzinella formosa]|uniref:hypothetical protein n=1 Tax=Zavarzinella formosa TaxID=360055 RepID=UPI0002E6C470|nr:hypothetical protein [Zavarzinella formosa]